MNNDDLWRKVEELAAGLPEEPAVAVPEEPATRERTLAVFTGMLPADIWRGLGIDPATAYVRGKLAEATGTAMLKRKFGKMGQGVPVAEAVPTKVELGTSSILHRGTNHVFMVGFVSVGMNRRQLPAIGAHLWDANEQVVAELLYTAMCDLESHPFTTNMLNAMVQMERTDLPTPDGTGPYECTFCSPNNGGPFSPKCPYCGGLGRAKVPTPGYDADLWELYEADENDDMLNAARRSLEAVQPSYLGAVIESLARDDGWSEVRIVSHLGEGSGWNEMMRRPAVPVQSDRRVGTWVGCDCDRDPNCPICFGVGSYVPGTPVLRRGEMGWKE